MFQYLGMKTMAQSYIDIAMGIKFGSDRYNNMIDRFIQDLRDISCMNYNECKSVVEFLDTPSNWFKTYPHLKFNIPKNYYYTENAGRRLTDFILTSGVSFVLFTAERFVLQKTGKYKYITDIKAKYTFPEYNCMWGVSRINTMQKNNGDFILILRFFKREKTRNVYASGYIHIR